MEARLIKNNSTKKAITSDFKICKSVFSKARGLMFSNKKNLIFIFNKEQRISLHMLFVFFPIWAVYLNKDKKVVFKKKLYPFISSCSPNNKSKYVLELIKKPEVKIGDKLTW